MEENLVERYANVNLGGRHSVDVVVEGNNFEIQRWIVARERIRL